MAKSDLAELMKQVSKAKLKSAKLDPGKVDPSIRKLAQRKQEVYAEVARLRLENAELDSQLIEILRNPESRLSSVNLARVGDMLCW